MSKTWYRLSREGEQEMLSCLSDDHRKDNITLSDFYFLYGLALLRDNVKNGKELMDKIEEYGVLFAKGRKTALKKCVNALPTDKELVDLRKLGFRIYFNTEAIDELWLRFKLDDVDKLIVLFDKELFANVNSK